MTKRYLITGALGCIGAWTVKQLVERGDMVVAADTSSDTTRLRLVTGDNDVLDSVRFWRGDIVDKEALARVVSENRVQRIIHLAALQVPASQKDPPHSARVNVVGSANILDIVRNKDVERAVFASSVAVYGGELSDHSSVSHTADQDPETFYGAFKRTVEATARLYNRYHGVDSIGLRPHTVYGPGRDTGLTSSPTWALLAAVRGLDYTIPFSGSVDLQHASDVAWTFIRASDVGGDGSTYSIRGSVTDMHEFAASLMDRATSTKITVEGDPLPFPGGMDDSTLTALLGEIPRRAVSDGIDDTMNHFASADPMLLPEFP